MRIIQVVNVRWFNATSWYGLTLSALLGAAGHKVLTLVLPGTATAAKAQDMGLETLELDLNTVWPARLYRAYRQLAQILKTVRPDIVNCHRGEAFVMWGLLRRLSPGFRLVRTRGDARPAKANTVNRWLMGRVADLVVATNSSIAKDLVDRLDVDPGRVRTILGGVDTSRFRFDAPGRERVRRELGLADHEVAVGLLGRFDPVKGQREAIEALHSLRGADGAGRIRLVLAGFSSVTGESQVREWVERSGLTDRVLFTGRREDVPQLLSALDVGLVASQGSEAIARAALELMACERPVISTRIGVMGELAPDEGLVAPGDGPGLARLMLRAALDEDFRERLRQDQAARLAGLDHAGFLAQSLAAFEAALDRPGHRSARSSR